MRCLRHILSANRVADSARFSVDDLVIMEPFGAHQLQTEATSLLDAETVDLLKLSLASSMDLFGVQALTCLGAVIDLCRRLL